MVESAPTGKSPESRQPGSSSEFLSDAVVQKSSRGGHYTPREAKTAGKSIGTTQGAFDEASNRASEKDDVQIGRGFLLLSHPNRIDSLIARFAGRGHI